MARIEYKHQLAREGFIKAMQKKYENRKIAKK